MYLSTKRARFIFQFSFFGALIVRNSKLFLELKQLDPHQVLSRQAQLDVANQLASQQFHEQAADAYEQFLRHYPNFKQLEHVELMLGLIYARYLNKRARARELLSHAVTRLHSERDVRMAREELEKLGAGSVR